MSTTPELRPERGIRISRRSWLIALSVHAVLLTALGFIFFSGAGAQEEETHVVSTGMLAEDVEESFEETEEDSAEVHEQWILADEPVEVDSDLPQEENFGASEGLSDAPYEGPANNGTIGIGGGAGGAFPGRPNRIRRGGARRRAAPPTVPTTWRRSPLEANAMRLKLGEDASLPLQSLHVRATVEGFRARVIFECDYLNDKGRSNLEGTFQWRLPDGATPYYLAFGALAPEARASAAGTPTPLATDLASLRQRGAAASSGMKEARIVPRAKAARAYTETTKRRIDPALMEWAGGNVFQSRVFPLQAGRLHRITVGYEVNLEPHGDELVLELALPEAAKALTADVAIRGATTEGGGSTWTTTSYRNPTRRLLTARVPARDATLLQAGAQRGFETFAAQLTPKLPSVLARPASPRAVFLLDTSTSSAKSFDTWLRLIECLLTENRDTMREFAVVLFNVEAYAWRDGFTANKPGAVSAFLAAARKTVLEGASDLGAALSSAAVNAGGFDAFLLSDGACTWGERDPALLAKRLGAHRLFAYRGIAGGTDSRSLEGLARATGGGVFLVSDAEPLAEIARAHRKPVWTLKDVRVAGAADIVVRGRPDDLFQGQPLWIAGRGRPEAGATVDLVLEAGGKRHVVRTPIGSTYTSDLADSTYGQIAVESLEALGPVVADTARAYALHYRIVGKTCSLLMLDGERDYARYAVKPEEDSEIVRLTRMQELFERAREEHGDDLLDAKARFLAWVRTVDHGRGHETMSPRVRRWMEALPTEAFEGSVETLRCATRTRDGLSADHRAFLADPAADAQALERVARAQAQAADALRAYSVAVEREPGDPQVARGTAFVARALGYPGQARRLCERALRARPFEPQGYLQVADCLAAAGDAPLALLHYEMALAMRGRPQIAATQYLGFLERSGAALDLPFLEARLEELRDALGYERADVVITMSWNTDNTDVDLHVRCPNGETCSFKKRQTAMGGHMSPDVRDGYGPEMFVLPKAQAGRYETFVDMYRADDRRIGSGTRILLTVREGFGSGKERVRHEHLLVGDKRGMNGVLALERPATGSDD